MALLITRNGTDWITLPGATGADGPCFGFDAELDRPVWRSPGGYWVDAFGNVVQAGNMDGRLHFENTAHSGHMALL